MSNPPASRIFLIIWALLLTPILAFHLLDHLFPFPEDRLASALATPGTLIRARDGSLISWRVDSDENWRLPVKLENIAPALRQATLAVEDKRFLKHRGVDPLALFRAVGQNLYYRRSVSGASTISMQTIRLLWQRPRRLSSKIVEAFRALQLERLRDKNAILELYLNLAPYGGNIVGVEAAARKYFGKSSGSLTLGEAALLAGLPQSPSRFDPRRHPEAAKQRRRQVLARLQQDHRITPAAAARAEQEELQLEGVKARLELRHFADWALRLRPSLAPELRTTIDPEWQTRVESLVQARRTEWSGRGLSGPAVVLLRVADSSVLAYLGNYPDPSLPAWQVDGVQARRQPGSLLKPFIFAALAESGKIAPSSRVYDLPAFWSDYAPRNIDRRWEGEMSASAALRQSRNIPAVKQLASLGVERFGQLLSRLQLDPGQPERLGLAAALGAREQSLLNLTNAYAALARLGVWLPVRMEAESPVEEGAARRIFSEEAAWLTLSALAGSGEAAPDLVWKTGTSWHRRDAWAIVLSRELAAGVWCGALRGGGTALGAEDALPLALDLVRSGGTGVAWERPAGVGLERVCGASGAAPAWDCDELVTAPVSLRFWPGPQCRGHAEGGKGKTAAGGAAGSAQGGKNPRVLISSPANGACYVLPKGEMETPRLALTGEMQPRSNGSAAEEVFWFMDGRFLGRGQGVEWRMEAGEHRVVASWGGEEFSEAAFSVREM